MIIPIASDHAGYKAKQVTKSILEKMGHEPVDFGTHSEDSVDYPDFAIQVAERVNSGDFPQGILVCGSGQGVCMTANKYPKVRAALVYTPSVSSLTRLHNNANVMCLPGRDLEDKPEVIEEMLTAWFDTEFEGGRHNRRVEKIESLTQNKDA
ncbi:MAG TPA: ribose 5-phosphate isomerase B [Balneolaceae bacterium]|nr:ribose 5-phosphate isomerase B [Balneolaceae bacterium]|tara:strand:+ start:103714 stop:104169 length:456 start_codon:yes stop_codon:yes gene_type:complete